MYQIKQNVKNDTLVFGDFFFGLDEKITWQIKCITTECVNSRRIVMDFSEMGNRIRKHRQLKSMTQDALAEKVGVSPAYIGMIERGERAPSLDVFILIANELNVTADELLTGLVSECYNARLAKYGEWISKLNHVDAERIFSMIEIALCMGKDE